MQNRNRLIDFENKLTATKGDRWGRDGLGVWDWHMHTEVYGMMTSGYREPYPICCDNLLGEESEKEWMCVYV